MHGDWKVPAKKETVLERYLTAAEAFAQWHAAPEATVVLDVRTPEEYIFVGHAPMAHNIPVQFLKYEYDAGKKKPVKVIKSMIPKATTTAKECATDG